MCFHLKKLVCYYYHYFLHWETDQYRQNKILRQSQRNLFQLNYICHFLDFGGTFVPLSLFYQGKNGVFFIFFIFFFLLNIFTKFFEMPNLTFTAP